MIDVCMGEHDCIDHRRIDGKAGPVAATFLAAALEQPTVDEHLRR
jgi:hypothetical protein